MKAIQEACGSLTVAGEAVQLVTLYEQSHGQVVYIPPGYGHYVANARWCIKASLHLLKQQDSLQAALALHVLGPSIFGARNAEDYSDFAVNLTKELNKLAKQS